MRWVQARLDGQRRMGVPFIGRIPGAGGDADGALDDALFAAAQATLGEAGVVEIVLACGYYTAVAFTLNVARVPLPEGGVPWAIPPGR